MWVNNCGSVAFPSFLRWSGQQFSIKIHLVLNYFGLKSVSCSLWNGHFNLKVLFSKTKNDKNSNLCRCVGIQGVYILLLTRCCLLFSVLVRKTASIARSLILVLLDIYQRLTFIFSFVSCIFLDKTEAKKIVKISWTIRATDFNVFPWGFILFSNPFIQKKKVTFLVNFQQHIFNCFAYFRLLNTL